MGDAGSEMNTAMIDVSSRVSVHALFATKRPSLYWGMWQRWRMPSRLAPLRPVRLADTLNLHHVLLRA